MLVYVIVVTCYWSRFEFTVY